MKTVCELNKCVGCMACFEICSQNAIVIKDDLNAYNALINDKCINCGVCHRICQLNNPARTIIPKYWYQGWSNDEEIRTNGSSGGLAMSIAKAFVNNGGIVCSCAFENGKFKYKFATDVDELIQFSGSKYVKSTPEGIYKKIKDCLRSRKNVLFIALPCHVSALYNFVGKELSSNLYTIDLICHGTPSPQVLELFFEQYNLKLNQLQNLRFRNKGRYQLEYNHQSVVQSGAMDCYSIAFLSSLIYTDNCYECQYAKRERVSDITLGDSWGSDLSSKEWEKGISLILCQTEKGKKILEESDIKLYPVDLETAIAKNHQLAHPSIKPEKWETFFTKIKNGKKFNRVVFECLPRKCIKQLLKQALLKGKIIR